MHVGGYGVALASRAGPVPLTEIPIRVELSRAERKARDMPGPKSSQWVEGQSSRSQLQAP